MKKKFASLVGMLLLLLFTFSGMTQNKTMTWTTKSDKAKELASKGAGYMVNVEFAQAYEEFKAALALDPDFTVALACMAGLTSGETKKAYAERAVKSAADKTEGEKLFASTVATGNTPESNRPIWAKLHEMFPDGGMITFFYVFSLTKPADQFPVIEEYIKKFPDKAWAHNLMGYLYLQEKKDTAMAKTCFEKYIKLYPEGCNPYDSMGEFYFMTGDMANSEKYYKMALEKYPFNSSSLDKLKEIAAAKEKEKNTVKEKSAAN